MLKFTINAKELKSIIDRSISIINKDAVCYGYTNLFFQITENGILKVSGTNGNDYLEIISENIFDVSSGIVVININDLKLISKMNNDDIKFTDISTTKNKLVNIHCGKKKLNVANYNDASISLPKMNTEETKILSVTETWLLETFSNLSVFTLNSETRKELQTVHFNTKDKRVEATNSHYIAIRNLKEEQIFTEEQNIMLDKNCLSIFKKVLEKKSNNEIIISQNNKYIKVKGKNFTYIVHRLSSNYNYLNLNNIFTNDNIYSFVADKTNMLDIMKYNCELLKNNKKPVVFYCKNKEIFTYVITDGRESLDKIEAEDVIMDDMYMTYNPEYIMKVMKIIDTDKPVFRIKSSLHPLFIDGNEYKFLVLPIAINDKDTINKIQERINKIIEIN